MENVGELGVDALLAEPVLLVGHIVVLFIVVTIFILTFRAQPGAMNLEHAAAFTLKDLLEEVLLDEGRVGVALVRLPEVFLLVEHLDQSLRQLAVAFFLSVGAEGAVRAAFLGVTPGLGSIFLAISAL